MPWNHAADPHRPGCSLVAWLLCALTVLVLGCVIPNAFYFPFGVRYDMTRAGVGEPASGVVVKSADEGMWFLVGPLAILNLCWLSYTLCWLFYALWRWRYSAASHPANGPEPHLPEDLGEMFRPSHGQVPTHRVQRANDETQKDRRDD